MSESMTSIPKRIFIVPYRNRVQQKFFFSKYMSFILEGKNDYEILFSHQCDNRTFNRGAIKNIGFIAARNKYPNHYKEITFIFNDVDTIPFHKIFDYETTPGVVKHYYGYEYTLGGIVVIKGADFERTNGYPCFWGWGMEDNVLQVRCERLGITIDRSVFYKIGSPEILQLFDGISRIISKKDPWRGVHDTGDDGLQTITQLQYTLDDKSVVDHDNLFSVHNPAIQFVNVRHFLTHIPFGEEEYYQYDLREPQRKVVNPDRMSLTKNIVGTTKDWTNIPYYPTTRERRAAHAKQLASMGKMVSPELSRQLEQDKIDDMREDHYNKHLIKPMHVATPTHRYSPQYAQQMGIRPRAQASAKVRMGGVY
ncbi:MAG: galactosyltransferase-related protein [Flavobacterium sp.]